MGDSFSLRPLTPEDLAMLFEWRNHPDVRRYMFTQHPIGWEEHQRWFESVGQNPTRRLMLVETPGDAIGFVQFSNVTPHGVADWGFYARPHAPKGSGSGLGTAALDLAFGSWQLHKVCGQAISSNSASIALHERLGFTQEGVLREHQNIDGQHHALICFGLLAHEWHARRPPKELPHDTI
jgi:UDP-4-amino-4,6-dideoxy-N-acetyl-beta-L-altrosamine N-acetyltransferase